MPPKGSGAGAAVEAAWEKAAVQAIIELLEAKGLVVCLPKLSGEGRTADGACDAELGAAVVAAIHAAVNAVRCGQGRGAIGESTLWKNIIRPLEGVCEPGDPAAFRARAAHHGLAVADARSTRANSAHVTVDRENAPPQPPPPPPPPPAGSPARTALSPTKRQAAATQPTEPTLAASPQQLTRRMRGRAAELEAAERAAEAALGC
eukprot:3885263-Prymnesium_polylepis.1